MPDNAREIFVKNLRYLMDARGITQADICRELNVSSATASDWCTGKKYPRVDAMQHLADLLGVMFSTLTTESGIQDYEDQNRLEALHQNPKLRLLFDIQKTLTDSDLNAVLGVVNAIAKERGDDD
jgi:repressor LexA